MEREESDLEALPGKQGFAEEEKRGSNEVKRKEVSQGEEKRGISGAEGLTKGLTEDVRTEGYQNVEGR